jgi:hypothetical protein
MKVFKLVLYIFLFSSVAAYSQQPTIPNTSICFTTGSKASITVRTTAVSPTYVWYFKASTSSWVKIDASSAGTVYSDFNIATLTITKSATLPVKGTSYKVIVTSGTTVLNSNEAILSVDPAPVTKTITGASAVCAGGSKTLTYGAGSVGTIQWQSSTTSATADDFMDLYGETAEVCTATDLQQTTWFRVINTSGVCDSKYSLAVQVVVDPVPFEGYIDGGDVSVCKTSNTSALTLIGYEGTIQWQKAPDAGGFPGTFVAISLATSDTYTATNLLTSTYFKAIVSSGVCAKAATEPVLIHVDSAPVTKTITGASAVCAGDSKILTYGTGSIGDIQWQYSNTSATADDFIDLYGETAEVYTATDLQQTTWFRVMNTSGVCDPKYSLAVQVVVDPVPVEGYIDGGDISVCKTSNTTALTLIGYEGTIQWQKAPDAGGFPGTFVAISLATSDTYTATNLLTSTYFKAIVSSGVCAKAATEPVLIHVDPTPVIKTITGASAVCAGDSKTLTYGTGSIGDIQWQYSNTSATADDFMDLYGETAEVYTATDLQQTTWFRVMNTSGVCDPKYSLAVQVVVDPVPVEGYIDGGDVSVCKTSNTTVLTLIGYEGTVQWQKAPDVGGFPGTFVAISSATSDTYTATNLLTSTYFKAIVSSGVCAKAATEPVLIHVDPTPVIKTITGASAVCAGGSKTLTYGAGSIGDIQWQYSTTSATANDFMDLYGETAAVYTATNLQQTTWFRVMNTSGVCGSVYSAEVQVLVSSNTTTTFTQVGSICSGTTLEQLPTKSINAITGTWTPALNNAISTTYTFTPIAGVCANAATMSIVVNSTAPPIGASIQYFIMDIPKTISDLVVSGSNVCWYSSLDDALANRIPLDLKAILVQGNKYYAMQTVNGCRSISPLEVEVLVDGTLGITVFNSKELQFYPNPVEDYLTLIYPDIISDIQLYNVMGESVFIAHPNSLKTMLNLNYLPSGIYFVEVKANNTKGIVRIIKK